MKTLKLISFLLLHSILCCAQSHVVISQVYAGGGNAGAIYANDFIELFNPTATDVSLSGWSIQYAGATSFSWKVTALTDTIKAGHYYLIKEYSSGSNGSPLPAVQDSGDINLSTTAGKVALCTNAAPLTGSCTDQSMQDLVGYGSTAACYKIVPATALSNTTALLRNDNGCSNADNNSIDFMKDSPLPRNAASPPNSCSLAGIYEPAATIHYSKQYNFLIVNSPLYDRMVFTIYNVPGQKVFEEILSAEQPVDIAALPAGIYIASMTTPLEHAVIKFVKE